MNIDNKSFFIAIKNLDQKFKWRNDIIDTNVVNGELFF